MPNSLPTPDMQLITNYPPSLAAALKKLFDQGASTLQLAATFATADAAVLFTVPADTRLLIGRVLWEVTTAWTGGTSSAIGLSSSNAAYNTKGDLLGGATCDVLAGLTAGFKGTVGAKLASDGVVVLIAGDTIRFDRITSVFTAGVGIAHVPVYLLPAS